MKRREIQSVYTPSATYRLQFNKSFTFEKATGLVEYLDELGISDIYASPFLMARPGSMHGYDVTDHAKFNPEIGDEDSFVRLAQALDQRRMGVIADVVPNHMCISHSSNGWWWDVLENGPSSPFAHYFDIDWRPPKEELVNKVLLPVLGRPVRPGPGEPGDSDRLQRGRIPGDCVRRALAAGTRHVDHDHGTGRGETAREAGSIG